MNNQDDGIHVDDVVYQEDGVAVITLRAKMVGMRPMTSSGGVSRSSGSSDGVSKPGKRRVFEEWAGPAQKVSAIVAIAGGGLTRRLPQYMRDMVPRHDDTGYCLILGEMQKPGAVINVDDMDPVYELYCRIINAVVGLVCQAFPSAQPSDIIRFIRK